MAPRSSHCYFEQTCTRREASSSANLSTLLATLTPHLTPAKEACMSSGYSFSLRVYILGACSGTIAMEMNHEHCAACITSILWACTMTIVGADLANLQPLSPAWLSSIPSLLPPARSAVGDKRYPRIDISMLATVFWGVNYGGALVTFPNF